jgi:hypothetical protein
MPSTQLRQWSVGGEHVGDVAERILLRGKPCIGRNVDAPAHHVLAFMVARGEPQQLDSAGRRRVVAGDRRMGDADAHNRSQVSVIRDQNSAIGAQDSRLCVGRPAASIESCFLIPNS